MSETGAGAMGPKLIVILPTYNERENLGRILPTLFDLELPNLHVLVVDDNSPDGTGELAEALARQPRYAGKLHILHRERKEGLGPAYIQGFKRALSLGAELVMQMDADLSHQPKYIPGMLALAREHDMVIGSRYVRRGSVDAGWGPLRKLLSFWANRVYAPLILGLPVKDATGGFRVLRRECLLGMDLDAVKANGYVFLVELAYIAHRLGYRIGETPIHFADRQHGQSKMSPAIAIEAALQVWQIKWRHRALKPADRRSGAPQASER